jgi:cell division protein FtsB
MLNILKNPLTILFFTVITIVFYISLSKTQQKSLVTLEKIENIQEENTILEQKNNDLEEKLQDIDTEEIIRNEFLMQKPGEYVVKVPSLPDTTSTPSKEEESSNLKKWMQLLF